MADKIVLLDFCETIADFQTFIPYLQYVIGREHHKHNRVLNSGVIRKCCALITLVMRAFGWKHSLYVQLLVRQLKGIRQEQLEDYGKKFYEERVRGHLIAPTLELISQMKKQGYRLMIVSGGSELYISLFAQNYGIDDVLSAQLSYENGVCSGKLLSACMGREKPERLYAYMQAYGITGELAVGISDSRSDLPMLGLCKRKIVISHIRHQPWVTEDMEEIIWG